MAGPIAATAAREGDRKRAWLGEEKGAPQEGGVALLACGKRTSNRRWFGYVVELKAKVTEVRG